jgi:tyrocidine synthetase-3
MHVVTSYTLDAPTVGDWKLPPIGKPISNIGIYILDDHERPVPVGVWGEIYIGGASGFVGYINRVGLTAEKLSVGPVICGDNDMGGLYRTGDIGRWLEDGNIEFRSRKDFQVKIRGFRVEPGEIEIKILSMENVRECAVVAREDAFHQKHLVAYVVKGDIEVEELNRILSDDLPRYMIPRVVVVESLPRLPNKKVDRSRLPGVDLESAVGAAGGYAAPCTSIQEKLVEIWAKVLGVEQDHIGIDHSFFEIGGHSLKATIMISLIHKELEVKVPLTQVFKTPSIRELSRFIADAAGDKYASIEPVEEKEYYPLSPAQRRMYFVQQLNIESSFYNMPQFFELEGELEWKKMEESFIISIRRHESLRTSFVRIEGQPMQKVHQPHEVEFKIEYYAAETGKQGAGRMEFADRLINNFVRPFDLSRVPLFRVGLIKVENGRHILMKDMHHIIGDGSSIGTSTKEFMSLYKGEELPLLRLQYKDFSEWQNKAKEGEGIRKQEEYWLKVFAGEIPVLKMPTDYPRPAKWQFVGDWISFDLGTGSTKALKYLALQEGATLYMILLAIYNILIAKLSGQEDIVVGSAAAGRRHADLEPLFGIFLNMLAMRNYPRGEKTFIEFLREVIDTTVAAYANQDYQFENLIERVIVNRDVSRHPLFDVMFGLQNMDFPEIEVPGLKSRPYMYKNRTARVDMTMLGAESGENLIFAVEYNTTLFKEETIERFVEYYQRIAASVIENPGKKIKEIEIITEEENTRILSNKGDDESAIRMDFDI